MLLQLQELDAALSVMNQLFPFFQKIVVQIESIAPHAPGKTKLDTAMEVTKNALATAGNDAATITSVAAMAPSMISLAKAQYNATLQNVQVQADPSAS